VSGGASSTLSPEALFAPLRDDSGVLLAVSGGPDSTALLLMAAAWSRRRASPKFAAATFDHALRAEAAAEALAVAALCGRLGVPHRILVWNGQKPTTRLQERAREARYAALAAHALDIGASVVVTAHHLDDQAETVLFRLARGSGISGLSGMAARTTRGGVALARPFLGVTKADLVAYCEAEGAAFLRDPSNVNRRFARARLRDLAPALAAEGLDAAGLGRLAVRARRADEALAAQTASAEARLGLVATGACDAAAWAAEPAEIRLRLLMLAVGRVGGREASRVGLEKFEVAAEAMREAFVAGRRHGANYGGALMICAGGRITVTPEPARRGVNGS
jgi:tRNA(Ile)-lysidine synthase